MVSSETFLSVFRVLCDHRRVKLEEAATPQSATSKALVTALVVMAMTAAGAPTASANHRPPFDGPQHVYGEMVSYDLVFPVEGEYRYTDTFWAARGDGLHHAQDIVADKGTPVLAAHDGTVSWISSRCCSLAIRHTDGWRSVYIHLNNDTPGTDDGIGTGIADGITEGTDVTAGQLIGWVGDSGNAEGTVPHLHFELEDPDGVYVNSYEALLAAEGKAPEACETPSPGRLGKLFGSDEVLERRSRGPAVRQLERFLILLGYEIEKANQVLRGETVRAIKQFQREHGLDRDGKVGSKTRAAIDDLVDLFPLLPSLADTGLVVRPGARGDVVRQLQRALTAAGYDPGAVDGVYGDQTTEAVETFQDLHDLTVDGKLGPFTRRALAEELGLGAVATCA